MTTENNELNNEQQTNEAQEQQDIAALVAKQVEEQLKDLKSKLDNAYKQRDEANSKLKERDDADKAARLKRMEEEGQFKELYELKLKEEREEKERLKARNTELSRDVSVRDAIAGLPFRNENAQQMATRDILSQLVQNDAGDWVHKSGATIKAFVDTFSKDTANAFLFKSTTSSGAGTSPNSSTTEASQGEKKSLFKMDQKEVLRMAMEGKLPGQIQELRL